MTWLTVQQWSPYAAGFGIGLLGCLTFLLSDKPLGCSTAFVRTSGMIGRLLGSRKVLAMPYYREVPPVVDWQWMLVVGIAIGAFVSAWLSGDFQTLWVPVRWAEAFGGGAILRFAVAVLGGICLAMGARMAGGCTSGHGISGTLQLALSSWLAVVCFFIGGVATAILLYGVFGQ